MDLKWQLTQFEGSVPYAYQDHLGFWTIGIGRLIDQRKGGGLSQDEIAYLLDNDIRKCTTKVLAAFPWAADLNEPRMAVLVNMCFQLGMNGLLGFTNTLADIKAGNFDDAALGMLRSKWATQTPDRAKCLSKQMATGEWQTP
jgi:lysozyme